MSFAQCIQRAVAGGMAPPGLGKEAQKKWRAWADAQIRQGTPPHVAENQAAVSIVAFYKRKAQRAKWRKLATMGMTQHQRKVVGASQSLRTHMTAEMDQIDFEARALERRMIGRINEFLREQRPSWMGKQKNPARMQAVVEALHGQPVSDAKARSFGDAIKAAFEDMRLMLNETGYSIGKLDTFGLPHRHDADKITRAGYAAWKQKVLDSRPNWKAIENPNTGLPYQAAGGPPPSAADIDEFLKAVYANFEYGKGTDKATYGKQADGIGGAEARRILHFEDAQGWIDYNTEFGASDPFNTIVEHIAGMSNEIAMARHFGPNPVLGAEFVQQLVRMEARKQNLGPMQARWVEGNTNHALRMQKVMMPAPGPTGPLARKAATFMSTTRKVITSALLDRAVVISVPSDLNSTRLAAQAVGMNPGNVISTYSNLLADAVKGGGATTDDLARQQWIADSIANPSATMSRYVTEFPAQEWAEILSNASMRIQGLQAHTDNLKLAFQYGFAGHMAGQAGRTFRNVEPDLRARMEEHGITEADWDAFRSGGVLTVGNGATFLNPLYWREATTLPAKEADRIFLQFQSLVEKWTERAVPTRSLLAQGVIDPKAWGLSPGSPVYEVVKSGGMFKSFLGAFVVNQMRMIAMQQSGWGKARYIADLLATSTVAGAMAIQAGDMMLGRDPQDMTDPMFWARAFVKGGGSGPLGDILSTGSASWGGGFSSYVAGPMPQVAQDAYDLVVKSGWEFAQKEAGYRDDTKFAERLARYGKRYTPMAQSPAALGGAAIDRLVFDQLQLILDPDSAKAMTKAAQARANAYGSGDWWLPGDLTPSRFPDLGNAVGR